MRRISNKQAEMVKRLYLNGRSAPFIGKKLNLSNSQVYDSLKKQKIYRRSPAEQNAINFLHKPNSFDFKSKLSFREKELVIAACMLYQGEGAKTQTTVDLANSDPKVLKLFVNFLNRICRIDKNRLRLYLYCFSDQNAEELMSFWSRELKINQKQFTKPYIRTAFAQRDRNMPYGVLHIRYSDKKLLEKILLVNSQIFSRLSNI